MDNAQRIVQAQARALMLEALSLLDAIGEAKAANHLQHGIDLLEPSHARWRVREMRAQYRSDG